MNNVLQEHWDQKELIGLDTMAFSDGSIKLINISHIENKELINTFGKEYHFRFLAQTNLNEVINKYDDDIWSVCQVNHKVEINNNYIYACGEGEMGNEGFIVKLDLDGNIQWSLYSTTSNPFYKITISEDQLAFISTANFAIVLDTATDNISINNSLEDYL